jgi:hypothetical protein
MKLRQSMMFIIFILFINACQSSSSSTQESTTKKSNTMILNENNYIKISQYNYERFSILKNSEHLPANSRYRSTPGKNKITPTKDLLLISASSQDDSNKEVMNIKQNSIHVVVEVDKNDNLVTVTYNDGKKSLKKDMTLEEFQNSGRGNI